MAFNRSLSLLRSSGGDYTLAPLNGQGDSISPHWACTPQRPWIGDRRTSWELGGRMGWVGCSWGVGVVCVEGEGHCGGWRGRVGEGGEGGMSVVSLV